MGYFFMGVFEGFMVAVACAMSTMYGYILGINQVKRDSGLLHREYKDQLQSKNEEMINLIAEVDRLKKAQKIMFSKEKRLKNQ